jgi:hypothetical protein
MLIAWRTNHNILKAKFSDKYLGKRRKKQMCCLRYYTTRNFEIYTDRLVLWEFNGLVTWGRRNAYGILLGRSEEDGGCNTKMALRKTGCENGKVSMNNAKDRVQWQTLILEISLLIFRFMLRQWTSLSQVWNKSINTTRSFRTPLQL